MGSQLLYAYGSPQLSVRVTVFPLMIIVLLSTVTIGTIAGTPVKLYYYIHIIACILVFD